MMNKIIEAIEKIDGIYYKDMNKSLGHIEYIPKDSAIEIIREFVEIQDQLDLELSEIIGSIGDDFHDGMDETDQMDETVDVNVDNHMAQFYDEDCDSGMGTYLSDGVYVREDGSLYDSKG